MKPLRPLMKKVSCTKLQSFTKKRVLILRMFAYLGRKSHLTTKSKDLKMSLKMSVFHSKKTIKLQLLAELELARLHYYSRFWASFKLLKERLDTQKMYHLLNRLPSSSQALFGPTSYSDCPLIKTTMTKWLMLVA